MNMMSTLLEYNPSTGAALKQRDAIAQDTQAQSQEASNDGATESAAK